MLRAVTRRSSNGFYSSGNALCFDLDWTYMEVKVSQLFLTLCNPMDYTDHGILQARTLEWVAFPYSREIFPRDLPNPGIKPKSPTLQADSLPAEPPGNPCIYMAMLNLWWFIHLYTFDLFTFMHAYCTLVKSLLFKNKHILSQKGTFSHFFFYIVVDFVIHWNETAMGLHVFPIPIPPPTSLSTRSL